MRTAEEVAAARAAARAEAPTEGETVAVSGVARVAPVAWAARTASTAAGVVTARAKTKAATVGCPSTVG